MASPAATAAQRGAAPEADALTGQLWCPQGPGHGSSCSPCPCSSFHVIQFYCSATNDFILFKKDNFLYLPGRGDTMIIKSIAIQVFF